MRLARYAQTLFDLEDPPRYDDFYEVFPRLLEAVTGETDLRRAGVDLVVKPTDAIRPMRGQPGPYDEFRASFGDTAVHLDLEHHLAHAHQAFHASPFEEAAILTIDGSGENLERHDGQAVTTTMGDGDAGGVTVHTELLHAVVGRRHVLEHHALPRLRRRARGAHDGAGRVRDRPLLPAACATSRSICAPTGRSSCARTTSRCCSSSAPGADPTASSPRSTPTSRGDASASRRTP